LLAYLMFTI